MNIYKRLRRVGKIIVCVTAIAVTFTVTACTTSSERQIEYKTEGMNALNKGDYVKAVQMFDEALQSSEARVTDDEIDICYYKAAAQFNAGDVKGAIKTYTALIDYDEDNPYPLFLRGSVYLIIRNSCFR